MICNFGVVCAFDVAYLINVELFPTIVLATAYGVCNIVGRFVSIFAPLAARIPNPMPLVILIVFSGLCVIMIGKL